MESVGKQRKPHAVCIPFPAQGHINPMQKLAKLLHHNGCHITFVHTEYNHKRLLNSRGPHALDGLPSFRFASIPDGLPPSDTAESTQDVPSLCESTSRTCLKPFRELLVKLNEESRTSDVPPVSCVVSDGIMSFTTEAAEEFGIPEVLFWTTSACGFLGYTQYPHLVEKGFTPLKEESYLTNGYLESVIDWIPGMKDIRLRDLPSFIRTTNPDDVMLNFFLNEVGNLPKASAVIINTFEALEREVLNALSNIVPRVLSIGPLHLLVNQIPENEPTKSIGSNLWREEPGCIEWLDSKNPSSVVYVNFGSVTVVTKQQFTEFAWGLANSNMPFLWIIRPDLVVGDTAMLPAEFIEETRDRAKMASWCNQEEVLQHPTVGGFLTHSGWNSTIESLSSGVPVICWPFFAEQQTNCRFCCVNWEVGMEIDNDVKRDEVEKLVRELMVGERGERMKKNGMKWKKMAEDAIGPGGSSSKNLEILAEDILS